MTASARITGLFSCCPAGRRGRLRRAVAPCQRQVEDRPEAGLGLNPVLVFQHGALAADIRVRLDG